MDIDTIEPGVDFHTTINEAVGSCDVLIALIGRNWLIVSDSNGNRRLDNPADFVRLEIAAALERDTRVIPALVQGVEMPRPTDLPEELEPLARKNAIELSDARWHYDMGKLATSLQQWRRAAFGQDLAKESIETPRPARRGILVAAALAIAATVGVGAFLISRGDDPGPGASTSTLATDPSTSPASGGTVTSSSRDNAGDCSCALDLVDVRIVTSAEVIGITWETEEPWTSEYLGKPFAFFLSMNTLDIAGRPNAIVKVSYEGGQLVTSLRRDDDPPEQKGFAVIPATTERINDRTVLTTFPLRQLPEIEDAFRWSAQANAREGNDWAPDSRELGQFVDLYRHVIGGTN
jgi:hypothetical protein